MLPSLLTEDQVSERWNIPVSTLRYWRGSGEGPNFLKLGRLVRYDAAALEAYLQRECLRVQRTRATVEEVVQRCR
jgi:hypothetical protein